MKRPTADPVKARTRAMYATLKRRAGNQAVMSLDELRGLYNEKMGARPFCGYCRATVTTANVSLDHKTPVNRGGAHDAGNLAFVCRGCNASKGDMTLEEFKDLMLTLDSWAARHRNPKLRDKILTALRVASSFRIGANRRTKKA